MAFEVWPCEVLEFKDFVSTCYDFLKVQDTNKVCEGYALGKHARGNFPKNEAWSVIT